MPKVDTIHITIAGIQEKIEVWFTTKEQFHIKKFPGSVLKVLNMYTDNFRSEILRNVHIKVFRAKNDYEKIIKTKHKIIFVRVATGEETYLRIGVDNLERSHSSTSCNPKDEYRKFTGSTFREISGYGFGIEYEIGYKYISGEKITYTQMYENSPDLDREDEWSEHSYDLGSHEMALDWTEEREQYLKDLTKTIDKTAEGIAEFFKNEKKLVKKLDSGTKLLEGG